MKASTFRLMLNLWPPFLASGIRVVELTEDYSSTRVRLRKYWFNQNYVGTHFGGSLYAMTDPFLVLLGIHRLGKEFRVWDKAAHIEFIKATKADVYTQFSMDDALVARIKSEAADGRPWLEWFEVEVTTDDGEVVARVKKQLYVRRKRRFLDAQP